MSEINRQLERIENKIDAINEKIDTQSNRITALETQGGMVKLFITITLPVIMWLVSKVWG